MIKTKSKPVGVFLVIAAAVLLIINLNRILDNGILVSGSPLMAVYDIVYLLINIFVPLMIILSVVIASLNTRGVRALISVVFAVYSCINLIYAVGNAGFDRIYYIFNYAWLFVISLIIVILNNRAKNNKKVKLPVILILIAAVIFCVLLFSFGWFSLTYIISAALTCVLLILCAYFDSRSILCEAKPKKNVPHREQIQKSIDETEQKLRQLQADFDSGRLDRNEFEKRRAEIINTL